MKTRLIILLAFLSTIGFAQSSGGGFTAFPKVRITTDPVSNPLRGKVLVRDTVTGNVDKILYSDLANSLSPFLGIESITESQDNLYRFDGYKKESSSHSSEGGFAKVGSNLFYIYRKGVNGFHISNTGDVYGKISTNNGKTWGTEYLIYSSAYDDRNLSVGNAVNGDIVVIFRRYNSTTSSDVDFGSITSSDGVAWSGFNPITLGGGIIDNATFGKVFTRGSVTHAVSYKSIDQITAHLLRSTDNGITWTVESQIYNDPLGGTIVAEPKLLDLPNGTSIVLARSNNNDIIQFNSADGVNFTYKGVTNINKELDPTLAEQPTPVELLVDGDNLIVVSAKRFGSANWSDNNYTSDIKFYVSKFADIFANQEAYSLSFEIPRPIRNVFAPYGYASLYRVDDNNIIGFISDNERMNESNLTASQLRSNESTYLFSFALKKYDTKEAMFTDSSNYGGNEYKSKNEVTHFVINQNDIDGYEDLFVTSNDFIWKQVPDPNLARFEGTYRGGFLGSTSANATGNWPQVPTSGGTVIHAQSSDTSHAFEIGIGNTGLLPDSILARRRNSSGVWSSWGVLAREEKVVLLTGNQTLGGVKTFSSSPIVPTATTASQAVNLWQMNTAITTAGNLEAVLTNGNTTTKGIISNTGGGVYGFDTTGNIRGFDIVATNSFHSKKYTFGGGANSPEFTSAGIINSSIFSNSKLTYTALPITTFSGREIPDVNFINSQLVLKQDKLTESVFGQVIDNELAIKLTPTANDEIVMLDSATGEAVTARFSSFSETGFESALQSSSQVISANTDTVLSLTGSTMTSNGGLDLINESTNTITPILSGDVISIDVAIPFTTPSGTSHYGTILLRVKTTGTVYRAKTQPYLKGAGNQDYLTAGWVVPINSDAVTNGLELIVNSDTPITLDSKFLSVTRVHKAK